MKTQFQLNRIPVDIDYSYDIDSLVKGFLTLSALNRMSEFKFKKAFEVLLPAIESKLNDHGLLSFEEYVDQADRLGMYSDADFEKFTISTDYIHIDVSDVKEAIYKCQYEKLGAEFASMFSNISDLRERMIDISDLSMKDIVILFDEIIHAQHQTGFIYEDLDIDSIKSDLDKELIELMGINQ